MIALAYRDSLPQGTADELDQLVQGLVGMLYQEHNPEGHHTNITADSITMNAPNLTNGVAGTITFKDRLGRTSTLSRDVDNASDDSILTLNNGLAFRIRRTDVSGVLYNLVNLGFISYGSTSGNGIKLYGKNRADDTSLADTYHDWSIISGDSNALPGARMLIGDDIRSISPISLRWRNTSSGFYEFMKTSGGSGPTAEQVNLGSGFDSSQQGFWDNAYIKSLTLGNSAGPTSAVIGTWADVPFSAGNFTAGGAQTWTVGSGDQSTYSYMLGGNSMTLAVLLNTTTVGGTPDVELRVAIPGGFSAAGRTIETTGWGLDNGVVTGIRLQAAAGNAYISIFNFAGSPWSAATDATAVHGEITFSIA